MFAVHIHPTARSWSRQSPGRLCRLSGPPAPQGGRGLEIWLRLECAVLNIFKVYQITAISEVACPKKDSITASNWGRFLPVLQIKLSLKWFVLGGLCPTRHNKPEKPHRTETQSCTVKRTQTTYKSLLLLLKKMYCWKFICSGLTFYFTYFFTERNNSCNTEL